MTMRTILVHRQVAGQKISFEARYQASSLREALDLHFQAKLRAQGWLSPLFRGNMMTCEKQTLPDDPEGQPYMRQVDWVAVDMAGEEEAE